MENIQELEEMRKQLSMLNRKIEREAIVNDKMMRRSLRSNMSLIRQKNMFIVILSVIMMPNMFFLLYRMGMSLALCIATVVFFFIVAAYTMYVNSYLCGSDLMGGNLLDVRRKVAKAMKLEHDWLRIGLPLASGWIVWYAYEQLAANEEGRLYVLIGMIVGLVVGIALGYRLRHKLLSAYKDVLAQISEMTEE